jgi:hypothetical protein
MKRCIFLLIVSACFISSGIRSQTTPEQIAQYQDNMWFNVLEISELYRTWQELLHGEDKDEKRMSRIKLCDKVNISDIYASQKTAYPEDPGLLEAYKDFLSSLMKYCDADIKELTDYAVYSSQSDENDARNKTKLDNISIELDVLVAKIRFYYAWIATRFIPPAVDPIPFKSALTKVFEQESSWFAEYRGEYVSQPKAHIKHYEAAKSMPGSMSGLYIADGKYRHLEFTYYTSPDSNIVYQYYDQLRILVFRCEHPGTSGYEYQRPDDPDGDILETSFYYAGTNYWADVILRRSPGGTDYSAILCIGSKRYVNE